MHHVDIYRRIHKALRACMAENLVELGSLDYTDAQELADVMARVRSMANLCASHLFHEDRFVHPAMEARLPGSARHSTADHLEHDYACRKIISLASVIEQARTIERPALVAQLYHQVARFMADSLHHMHQEETENNTVLWATHSNEELEAIEQSIVASLSAEEREVSMQWMMRALNPVERAILLEGVARARLAA
jgi:hypothetical protein